MRRKIIKQGNNSYTLTLPIDWIREQKLEENKEVEISQEDNNLILSLPRESKSIGESIEYDLKDYQERTIINVLNTLYRKGYGKIILKISSKSQLASIKKITRNTLLGFEVIEEAENKCVLQNIAEPSSDNFDSILRKIFLSIQEDSELILKSLKEGKKINLEESKSILDNYSNLCRRLIVRDKISGIKTSYNLFLLVSRLSLIYHAFYYITKDTNKNIKISKKCQEEFEKVINLFKDFTYAFYKRDFDKADKIALLRDKYRNELLELLSNTKGQENIVIYHLIEATRTIGLASIQIWAYLA